MEGTTEKDCSPLWNLYQQIVSDMKNSAPMWEEFISKANKLHTALKSALVAIAAFLDAFQKIADAATNARGATKEIGTALTRVCLRHRAIETRLKTFISTLMDTLVNPLSDKAEEWRRGGCHTGALSREHARECKRARAELRRRAADAQRQARKSRRAPDAKRRVDVSLQDIQERKQQLEEMEEKAVKAALIEERSRFCHFVSLLNPVVESEVAMLAEVGHLQEGSEQLIRHTAEPRTLPPPSLQVICDVKSCYSGWAEGSPPASRLGSRKSSLTSLCSLASHSDDHHGSTVSCSTPVSNASSSGTLPASNDPNSLSQGSDNQSVHSECLTLSNVNVRDDSEDGHDGINAASATWPDLKDTAQFERAASAIMGGRPHTISAGYERGHPRAALSVHTFRECERDNSIAERETAVYARPPLPTRCSSLERPCIPVKSINSNIAHHFKPAKPSSLPPHLTKEMSQAAVAVYVNMSELASLAAHHDPPHPAHEKVCSESSASESSLESSSGCGSQGAFAAEDQALQQAQHPDVESELVTLRRASTSVDAARESFSISLGSLEEAVRSLDEATESPAFATIGKKPAVPKRRPVSMTAGAWSRRGSTAGARPPPPVRRSSSISRQRTYGQGGTPAQSPQMNTTDADNLPPPPAFLLQPDNETSAAQTSVAEAVKQLNELKHMPASPGLARRPLHSPLSSFQQPGARGSLNNSTSDLFRDGSGVSMYSEGRASPHGSSPSTPSYGDNSSFSSFGPRVSNESSHYGQTGFKLQQEKKYSANTIYAQPSQVLSGFGNKPLCAELSPLAVRRNRSHSAHRQCEQGGLIASLSAKLAPQLSPRTARRTISTITPAECANKGKGVVPTAIQPAFLDKLSATLQHQRRLHSRATTVRDIINAHAQPDPRVCHTSLMEQIKRGATLRRNNMCNDRSAPKIR